MAVNPESPKPTPIAVPITPTILTNPTPTATKVWQPPTSDLAASNPLNWTPNGVPSASETANMFAGSMTMTGLVFAPVLNVGFNGGTAPNQPAKVSIQNSTVSVKINSPAATGGAVTLALSGTDHVNLNAVTGAPRYLTSSKAATTLDFAANTTMIGSIDTVGEKLTLANHGAATWQNDASSQFEYDTVKITPDLLGHGTMHLLYASKLEFAGKVDAAQTISLEGPSTAIVVDTPASFAALVKLADVDIGSVMLNGLKATSYSVTGDAMSFFGATHNPIDTLHIHTDLAQPWHVMQGATGIMVGLGTSPVIAGFTLVPTS